MAAKKINPKDPKTKKVDKVVTGEDSKQDMEGRKSGRIKLIR